MVYTVIGIVNCPELIAFAFLDRKFITLVVYPLEFLNRIKDTYKLNMATADDQGFRSYYENLFNKIDKNKNGSIDRHEVKEYLKSHKLSKTYQPKQVKSICQFSLSHFK